MRRDLGLRAAAAGIDGRRYTGEVAALIRDARLLDRPFERLDGQARAALLHAAAWCAPAEIYIADGALVPAAGPGFAALNERLAAARKHSAVIWLTSGVSMMRAIDPDRILMLEDGALHPIPDLDSAIALFDQKPAKARGAWRGDVGASAATGAQPPGSDASAGSRSGISPENTAVNPPEGNAVTSSAASASASHSEPASPTKTAAKPADRIEMRNAAGATQRQGRVSPAQNPPTPGRRLCSTAADAEENGALLVLSAKAISRLEASSSGARKTRSRVQQPRTPTTVTHSASEAQRNADRFTATPRDVAAARCDEAAREHSAVSRGIRATDISPRGIEKSAAHVGPAKPEERATERPDGVPREPAAQLSAPTAGPDLAPAYRTLFRGRRPRCASETAAGSAGTGQPSPKPLPATAALRRNAGSDARGEKPARPGADRPKASAARRGTPGP
ncbi:MAG: hypothetical protein AAF371_15320 [Pseudomonadota bacterium]